MPVSNRIETFGRSGELGVLTSLVPPSGPTHSAVVLVGEAGIGKTHLLRAMQAQAEQAGFAVFSGGGVWAPGLIEEPSPYGPIREAVITASGAGPGYDALLGWLQPPEESLDARTAQWLDPVAQHHDRFRESLARLADRQPVLLAVDDLHWVDRSSLALLLYLVRTLRDRPVLLTMTTRPSTPGNLVLTSLLDHLRRLPQVRWLPIGPMPDADLRRLVEREAAGLHVNEARVAAVVDLADGNPLAALELTRANPAERIPPSVAASVTLRLAAASSEVRAATEAASVLGVSCSHQMLGRLLSAGGHHANRDGPTEAVAAGLLIRSDNSYRFSHPLEQEAVYATIAPPDRADWHRRAAIALEADAESPVPAHETDPRSSPLDATAWARIVGHWTRAGDSAQTCRTSLHAARAAAGLRAFPEALAHQLRALDHWPGTLEDDDPATATAEHDEAVITAAEYARWASDSARGLELLERRASVHSTALLWERIGWFRREIGDYPAAVAAYDRASDCLNPSVDVDIEARLLAGRAAMEMIHGRLAESTSNARRGLDLIGEVQSGLRAHLLTTLGVDLAFSGEPEQGLALLHEARDLALSVGDEAAVWRYIGNVTFVLQNLGRFEEAIDIGLAAYRRAKQTGLQGSLAVLPAIANAVSGLNIAGRWDDAVEIAEEVLAGDPPPAFRSLLLGYAGEAHWWAGRDDDAADCLDQARSVGTDRLEPARAADLDLLAARLASARLDLPAARAAIDAALARPLGDEDPDGALELIIAALHIEGILDSRTSADRVATLELRLRAIATSGPAEPALLQWAEAELARSRVDDSPECWRKVADLFENSRRPQLAAECHLRRAEAAIRLRNRRTASRAVADVARLLARFHSCRLEAELADFTRRTRIGSNADGRPGPGVDGSSVKQASALLPTPLPERAAAAGLTPREIDVLRLLTEGASNRQLARALGITEKTASVHVSNLIGKLGVRSRMEAAAAAHRQRLLDVTDP